MKNIDTINFTTHNKVMKEIDFNKTNRFPKFNKEHLKNINKLLAAQNIDTKEINKNKPIVLKQTSIIRNKLKHPDVKEEEYKNMIFQALYNTTAINAGKKDGYLEFIGKITEKHNSSVVIDTKDKEQIFAIIHIHKKRHKINKMVKMDCRSHHLRV